MGEAMQPADWLLEAHLVASLGQSGAIHEEDARRPDGWFTHAPTRQAPFTVDPFVLPLGSLVRLFVWPSLHESSARADSIAMRRGEVSALARAQGEGINACGRIAATPFTVSASEPHSVGGFGQVAALLFIRRFKIQIQGANCVIGSAAWRPKSEIMGGIGEERGGVAGGNGRHT
jgi:hypothetical protein